MGKKVLPGVFFGKGEEQGVGRSLVPWEGLGSLCNGGVLRLPSG